MLESWMVVFGGGVVGGKAQVVSSTATTTRLSRSCGQDSVQLLSWHEFASYTCELQVGAELSRGLLEQ